jgi:hypothetical protein
LSDPNLLGKALADASWSAWRTLLIAAMGEKLSNEERRLFTALTGRGHEPNQRVDQLVLVIGRKGGKTRIMALMAVYLATLVDHRASLAVGERGVVLVVAQSQAVAKVLLRYAEGILEQSPLLRTLIVNRTQDTIELSNGLTIEVRPCNYKSLRGPTYIAALCDEAAFWFVDEEAANPDHEVIAAIRPALGLTHGPLVIASSPYARKGVLWDRFRRHYGANGDPLILVAQAGTRDLNPTYPQSTIDAALDEDHARNAAEYLAQFRSDLEAFVSREVLEQVIDVGVHERGPMDGMTYYAFADPSGGSSDSFTLAIGHREKDIVVLDALREHKPPFSPADVVSEHCALLSTYRITKVWGDRYAGAWPAERYREHGKVYEPAQQAKADLYLNFLPALNAARVRLLDHQRLIGQLTSLERRTTRGTGKDVIDHAPGAHDDVANCVAGVFSIAKAGSYVADLSWVRDDSPEAAAAAEKLWRDEQFNMHCLIHSGYFRRPYG